MNTHVPQVIGAARRYELSVDYRFADVARFFFETVSESRTYATGGSSNNEHWLTGPNHLAIEMHVSSHHQECCCSYNMMKLARHLYAWDGDPRLIDYYERNLLNHRLGAIEPGDGTYDLFSVARARGLEDDLHRRRNRSGAALAPRSKNSQSSTTPSTHTTTNRSM